MNGMGKSYNGAFDFHVTDDEIVFHGNFCIIRYESLDMQFDCLF